MEKEQIIKFVLAGILLILLFFVGTGYTTTNYNNTSYINGTLDASDKINKTGDTVGNSFRLDTTDGNGYIATTTNSNIIGYNVGSLSTLRRSEYRGYPGYAQIYLRSGIATTRTYNFSLDGLDMDTKNISNCGNCVNKSETQYNNDINNKVNKSGDIIKYINLNTTDYKIYVGDTISINLSTMFFDSYVSPATSFVFRAFRNGGTSTQFYGYAGTSVTGMVHRFALRGATGNESYPSEIKSGQQLQFDFQGYNSSSSAFNTVSSRIENVFTQNGSQGRGANLSLYATPNNGTLTEFMRSNGTSVFLPNIPISGSGNAYLCYDKVAREVFVGNPTC